MLEDWFVRNDSGRGTDPARALELLWRDPTASGSRRGPRQGLTVDRIITAAIELADSESVHAVTMRRVGLALGVAPMSLYTYVPGKAELLDLMLDTLYGQMPRTDLSDKPWRVRVEAVARENLELYQRHPWMATASPSRPPLGPGLLAKYEHELTAFVGLGLDDVEMDAALAYLLDFVQASARSAAEAADIQRESTMSDEQWWAVNGPLLARVVDETRFPTAARVGAAAGAAQRGAHSPTRAYEFGLQRVLDGLGVLIEGRGT
jgi:AcrR family transcriptional regulator